jgi:hypothetical protein
MIDKSVRGAAYHEAAHAVIAVTQKLALQTKGIHIDTLGEGIAFVFQREPGDPSNGAVDVDQRERTILGIKAGFIATIMVQPDCNPDASADDCEKVQKLLRESCGNNEVKLTETDSRLTSRAHNLVNKYWPAIDAVANALLEKPVTPRPAGSRSGSLWKSPDDQKRSLTGPEVAEILRGFGLTATVRDS